MTQHTFVLVHGAWHGGWCWQKVAGILRQRGHRVTTPTQTGLGERRHLLSREITLETFIDDIVTHLCDKDIQDAVLVGHSFAGSSISGAAERAHTRIARLIYLDALVLQPGETPFSGLPEEVVARRAALANDFDGGLSIPPPPPAAFGVSEPDQAAWLQEQLTPHPLSSFLAPLNISAPPGAGHPHSYILCDAPLYGPLQASRDYARNAGWRIDRLATGHDAMVSAPRQTADLLEALAGGL